MRRQAGRSRLGRRSRCAGIVIASGGAAAGDGIDEEPLTIEEGICRTGVSGVVGQRVVAGCGPGSRVGGDAREAAKEDAGTGAAPPDETAEETSSCILRLLARDKMGNPCLEGGASVVCGVIGSDGQVVASSTVVGVGEAAAQEEESSAANDDSAAGASQGERGVGGEGGDSVNDGGADEAADGGNEHERRKSGSTANEAAESGIVARVSDESDGTFLLRWWVPAAGEYEVFVKMDGLHVLGEWEALDPVLRAW